MGGSSVWRRSREHCARREPNTKIPQSWASVRQQTEPRGKPFLQSTLLNEMPKVLTRAQTSPQRFVLIVDPDADSRAFYRELLALEGLDAVEAVDGRDGMTMALINPPALVMTELVLPFVDGYSLCQVLRADAATRGVPIVMITADARDAALRLARSAGADGVLVKPAPVDRILEEVRRLLVSSPPAA